MPGTPYWSIGVSYCHAENDYYNYTIDGDAFVYAVGRAARRDVENKETFFS